MQDEFRVYGRDGEPCDRCGTPIERIRRRARDHYCPHCQPLAVMTPEERFDELLETARADESILADPLRVAGGSHVREGRLRLGRLADPSSKTANLVST